MEICLSFWIILENSIWEYNASNSWNQWESGIISYIRIKSTVMSSSEKKCTQLSRIEFLTVLLVSRCLKNSSGSIKLIALDMWRQEGLLRVHLESEAGVKRFLKTSREATLLDKLQGKESLKKSAMTSKGLELAYENPFTPKIMKDLLINQVTFDTTACAFNSTWYIMCGGWWWAC